MKIYPAIVAMALLLVAAPFALAANGDGMVVSYKPDVASTGDGVTLQIQLYNDGGACLDEIIITPPDTWGGTADVTEYDRSAYSETREETNDDKCLSADSQSSRIVPTHALCPGETVNIEITGLTAPSSYEVSDIVIKTSDQTHNYDGCVSEVYKTIDTLMSGKSFALPKVYVTKGTQLEIEYFHIESFTGTGGSKGFTARAWGAWARLENLTVLASVNGPITITMETGTTDNVIFSGSVIAGVNTLPMNYLGWVQPLDTTVYNGFLEDQAGARAFRITYGGTLTLLGSTDEILDDIDYTNSGLGPMGAQGTIITANGTEQRKIMVNLVDDNGYDINEIIPLDAETDLGSIVESEEYYTDSTGNKYFTLNPGCEYGIADVKISTDPLKTTPSVTEYVGIDSNVPASFAVVEGSGAYVGAGESQLIKVNVYDSCGNLVSNTHQQLVEFDYLTATCGSQSKLAQEPDGASNNHEQELTDMGVAEVYLVTDCQLCTHNVQITVPTLPGSPKTIQLFGVNGKPYKMEVTIDENEIQADDCVTAAVEVVDKCGNLVSEIPSEVGDEMEQWESIVRLTINDALKVDQECWAGSSQTYIASSDFREEYIHNYGSNPYVQGKLNQGAGEVQICGCQGLGTFEVVVESDTLIQGNDSVSVVNADPDCIETNTVDQLLQCEQSAEVMVAIKDVCGNYWRNQGCGSGEANYCVDLELSGSCGEDGAHLSTETVCVPVGFGDPGYLLNNVTLFRDTEDCCELGITADKGSGCCLQFPDLEQCNRTDVLFHGAPAYMTTQFFKTRKICEPICPPGRACVAEIQFEKQVYCYEQLHEEIVGGGIDPETELPINATETVSEEVLDLFTVYDACGHIVKDYDGTIDVEVKGEDCASIYQVNHTLELEGGWCSGHVDCNELTQFGQAKCEETPTDVNENGGHCEWEVEGGQCSGTPNCSVMMFQQQCFNWGCVWDGTTTDGDPLCNGDPDFECEDPTAPGAGQNQEICGEVGCTWTDNYECTGSAARESCAPYTKDQCTEIGATVPESCEWNDVACQIDDKPVINKVVIHNCKPETVKQWLPIEKDDIIVDKLAFQVNHPEDPALWMYIYVESEKKPGFQPSGYGNDYLVGKAPVNLSGPTIIELEDSDFSDAWDNQREGGVMIRAGDSKDFYVILKQYGKENISCGTYDAEFLWYQDYSSPDLTNSGSGYPDTECGLVAVETFSVDGVDGYPHCGEVKECNGDGIIDFGPLSGMVEDGCIDSDNFNWIDYSHFQGITPCCGGGTKDSRNDDYKYTTPDYGFGDRFLYSLQFETGQAWLKFRDLVAEDVQVITSDVIQSGEVCTYSGTLPVEPNPEEITFVEQPATQIELINHDKHEDKTAICEDEWDADENAYLLNIQTTDGFENPHAKEIEVELEYCLKSPFGDWFVEDVLHSYCRYNHDDEICDAKWMDNERCFTREDLKNVIKNSHIGEYFGDVLFGDFFGEEFSDWVDSYFDEAKVEFWDIDGHALPFDSHGHQVVITDSNGQAQVYVTAQKTGLYKVIARPLALDAASTYVNFGAGIPQKLDLMALPAFGIPADGEQEAMLFLRALDACGNLVHDEIDGVTVSVTDGDQVFISQDFDGKNNYDDDVIGNISGFGWTKLAVLSDMYGTPEPDGIPQTATLTASAYGLDSDTTQITFAGAPLHLKITEITPSDRLPADGETGAWVTVEVQDKNGNRVTTYLGDGFSGDPGDPFGFPDYTFNDICLDLDTVDGSFFGSKAIDADDQYTFGWVNLHHEGPGKICGDLMFGKGKVYVTYGYEGCTSSAKVKVTVFDKGENGQEINENNLPHSYTATTLTPDSGEINFVQPATQWDIWSDKLIALADGQSTVMLTVQVENPFMDIRQAVDGTVYVGGVAESGAKITWDGMTDALNPTKANIVTDPVTGKAYLKLTSTKPGKAEITITGGKAYVCEKMREDGVICGTCQRIYKMYDCEYSKKIDLAPKTIEVEFLEVASKQIYLDKGWNFISVPYALNTSNDSLSEIFNMSNIVAAWRYSGGFIAMSGSDTLAPLNGYWIKVLAPEVVTLKYATPAMPSIPTKSIASGWNAVGLAWDSPIKMEFGLKSIDSIYSNVIGWIAGLQKYAVPVANSDSSNPGPFETGGVDMQPKQGYWVWSTGSGNLAGLAA